MEKRLRSSLQSSAEEFLTSATKLSLKSSKPSLKTLIHKIKPSSDLSSSLPISLSHSISDAIRSFQTLLLQPNPNPNPRSPRSPPTKRPRRSSRSSKTRPDREPEPDLHPDPNPEEDKHQLLSKLQILACIAQLCAGHPAKAFPPLDLLPGVQALHDNLIILESDSALVSAIASLCEQWWKEELPGRESLISQSLPFLLSRSLTLNKKADIHRVYALREAFTCFDFEDESIEDLKLLLIRCVISPLFLKTEEGRKFLAFLFGLSSQLLKEVLAVIKSQIPFGRKSMLEAYGDVLFRAWKVAEGELRSEIENGFLQVLIEGAIHATSGAFAASIRRVLGGFINQRTTAGVEKLLFQLSEPVIFRSLQVANSNVRQNALHLLLDLFPLEDPDSTKEVKDSLLDKQFFLLGKLLVDDCPEVRVVAVEGSCRILHLFWEVIPSPTITKLVTRIFDDMSHDTSHEVRLSTLNGTMYLFGNPLCHQFLNVLLPRLGHLMMDNVLSIRVAMVDLLLLIRDIQNFQFHKVVKLDVLLSTLENDQPQVAQKITRLLMPSYFPSKETVETACNRCTTLVKRSPMAGARFCEFAASQGASLKSLMELVRVMITLVLPPNNLDEQQVEGLLTSSSNLCNTLAGDPVFKKELKEFFDGEKLKYLIAAAPTGPAQSCVFNIVSTVSPDDVAGLLDECMHLVTNCSGLSKNVEKQSEVRSAHNLLLSCDAIDGMLEALTALLQKSAYRCHIKYGSEIKNLSVFSAKRKKSKSSGKISARQKHVSGKKVTSFEDDYSVAAGIAWQIRDLLVSVNTQKAILGSQILESLLICLKVISEVSIVQCMDYEYVDTFPVSAYTALALHLSLQNVSSNKNDGTDSSGSTLEQTELEQALDHVLNCTEKLCGIGDSGQSSRVYSESKHASDKSASRREKRHREPQTHASIASDSGNVYTEPKKLANKVKMLTAVQRFMVDAATIGFAPQTLERCLRSTSGYIRCVISTLEQQPREQIDFEEEDLKDVVLCLKSSSTYAAKLLNLALKDATEASPPPAEASDLANDMLDLIISIELYLGSTYAGHVVAAVKPWVPDLILALGSGHIMKQIIGEECQTSPADRIRVHFPSWLLILAKTELSEASEVRPEDDGDSEPKEFPAFKKLLTMIVKLLKENLSMQGVLGAIFMIGATVGLEKKNFGLVFGLLRFVCLKIFKHDDREWGDLMLAFLQDIYPQIEREIEEECDEDGRETLEKAKDLLEPIWLYHLHETGRVSMMEE
ncbi:putative condensin-2 complex subunit G2 [Rosa chinensis]|uniref:Putative condensin-2 complex subunit G2 n=1 Tax=Rosa chinensis TaxID=74649 RepID=A0A2P6RWX1_ROSCH|nr:uncharacterized protein LOC112188970 isoform X1 [Rosa chinensis]PRQ50927.1 putative condensin-2 complex subunit G2 [Rosa chinensis]